MPSDERVIAATRGWLEAAVIGLGLCPFAKAVHVKGQIRYFVSQAETAEALLVDLLGELSLLEAADPERIDTTLLIHPRALAEFLDFNDFLSVADAALVDLGLSGTLQIASFHPHYCFAGNEPEDPANYVTRSPYPMLHLLREASVDRAVEAFPDASAIVDRNIERLRSLGVASLERLLTRAVNTPG